MDFVLLSEPRANHFLSRCPEGKWDGMKQGCSWHLCVGLLLKTGSSSHLYIQSLCTHYVLRSSKLQAPEIWSAFGKLCRLDAVCQNFLRGLTSHLIRFTSSSRTVVLHSYVTFSEQELKKSINVSFPFSCLTCFKVSDSCCQFQKKKKRLLLIRPY